MKSVNFTTSQKSTSKQRFSITVEEKKFPGEQLDANVFKNKFNHANKAGRTIKGLKK